MIMSSNIKPLERIHLGSYSQGFLCFNGYIIGKAVKEIFFDGGKNSLPNGGNVFILFFRLE